MKKYTSIVLIAAILIILNILAKQFFFRVDLTEDNRYTLSKATKDILKNLDDPVTVTAYFSDDLPAQIASVKEEFREMLVEYSTLSKGMVDYEFINPNEDQQKEMEVMQMGIQPRIINVRAKDQAKQIKAYLGAVIKLGEQQDVIPLILPGSAMEYSLSTGIKKLSVSDKPAVGLVQGHGEPALSDIQQIYQSLSILYNVENVDLNTEPEIASRFRAIAIINPQDSIPPSHLQKLDNYLGQGGKIFLALNAVEGDFQTQMGNAKVTGFENWLRQKGIEIEASFVTDASAAPITVQQNNGLFTFNTQVQFPYFPMVKNFPEHPITKGIEQIALPFASPLRYVGNDPNSFTPLLTTSQRAGILQPPTQFQVGNKQWTNRDFPLSDIHLGGIVQGNLVGETPSTLVVVADGDFAVTNMGGGMNPDNINLLVNSIDWLSDDTGLIELRTKGVNSRPIDDLEDGTRAMLKYVNFGLPILLILLYALFRFQRQRSVRMKRMSERYV